MSYWTYFKAKTLLKRGAVKLELKRWKNQGASFFFRVKEYEVRIDTQEGKLNCTCEHGSIWKVGEECSHIKACLLYLEKRGIKIEM